LSLQAAPHESHNAALRAPSFNLALTVECGQFFRWEHDGEGGYLIQSGPRAFRVRQQGDRLLSPDADDAFLARFFALDHPIDRIARSIRLEGFDRGLRIIRQEPWDCLVGYLLSMASNIPRIRGTLRRLGDLSELGDEARLRAAGAGFRAPYLVAAARWARAGGLARLAALDDEAARAELTAIPGVGPKVADCVLLYAFGRMRAFPIDVWVRRALVRLYFGGRRTPDRRLQEFAARRFGPWAGYAQQMLFLRERAGATRSGRRAAPSRANAPARG
jgi:N-glycosylase/DNA lyase